jgi:hypothetical protein
VGAKRQVSAYARVLARHGLGKHPKVAGSFVGRELQPLRSDSQEELTEAYLQAVKDGATPMPGRRGVFHRADVHEVDLGNGVVIPVLPPSARVAE